MMKYAESLSSGRISRTDELNFAGTDLASHFFDRVLVSTHFGSMARGSLYKRHIVISWTLESYPKK
jgi:hypothetical protein